MNKNQIDMTDLINRFEDIHYKLIFMEAALRGMTESKIIGEPGISEGISCIFNSIIQEREIIAKQLQKIVLSLNNAAGE